MKKISPSILFPQDVSIAARCSKSNELDSRSPAGVSISIKTEFCFGICLTLVNTVLKKKDISNDCMGADVAAH